MKTRNYFYFIVVAIFLSDCSSKVYVQKDDSANFINYHTYMWVDTKANENDKSAKATAYADISVRNAVNEEINKIGWKEVTDNPDVLISYDVLVERSVDQRSDPVYSQSFTRMYYNPRMRQWRTIYYPSQFVGYQNYDVPVKEGTITITMMDADTDKNIWQAWTTETLNYSRLTDDEIGRSVKNIFGKFDMASR